MGMTLLEHGSAKLATHDSVGARSACWTSGCADQRFSPYRASRIKRQRKLQTLHKDNYDDMDTGAAQLEAAGGIA